MGSIAVLVIAASGVSGASQSNPEACRRAITLIASSGQETGSPTLLADRASAYEQALVTCPDHPGALNNLGDIYERMGRYDDAIIYYQRAATAYRVAGAEPRFQAIPLFGLGDTYRKKGEGQNALYWYRKGLDLDPSDAESLKAVAELTTDDPPLLVSSRSIRDALDPQRDLILVSAGVTLGEQVLPFAFDSAELLPSARSQIREIAYALFDLLGAAPGGSVPTDGPAIAEIGGYADSRGTALYNLDLSRRRADAVTQALVMQYRIPRSRLRMVGHGATQFLCQEMTEACHARNRRVEIRRP